jgi:hypothetical protein
MNFPGNVRYANVDTMFMSDARKQIEKLQQSRRNQWHAAETPHPPARREHESTYSTQNLATLPFNIPRKPRLDSTRDFVETRAPRNEETYTMPSGNEAHWNTTALFASDHFTGQNAPLTDNMSLEGAIPEPFAQLNEVVGVQQDVEAPAANIFDVMHQHEEENLIDPVPLRSLPIQPVLIEPVQVFPTHHHHVDTHGEPATRQEEEPTQLHEVSQSADQQIDSMLLELFRR